MDDVAAYPKITQQLLAAGYSYDDLSKIWSGNALRVLKEAEKYRAEIVRDATCRGVLPW